MHDQTLPFLQNEMQAILERCVQTFRRVVILVDDVDVLPSRQFHELFRVLRPATKVPGVAALVCVPRFFFELVKSPSLGDLHSTVRRCEVVGLSDLFEGADKEFAFRADPDRASLLARVTELLLSRVRLPIDGPPGPLAGTYLFSRIMGHWERAVADPDKWTTIKDRMAKHGPSRREILRVTESLARGEPLSVVDRDASHLKTNYDDVEQSLDCDVELRANRQDAKSKLHGG